MGRGSDEPPVFPTTGRSVSPQPHPARELVVHAATLFGNLQSFMRQALDQALATQALWHSLSSRLRVSLGPDASGKGSAGLAVPPLPHLGVGAGAKPSDWDICPSSSPQALAEHLPGQGLGTWRAGSGEGESELMLPNDPVVTSPPAAACSAPAGGENPPMPWEV